MTLSRSPEGQRIEPPDPSWPGEPDHGGWYTEAEYRAAAQAMRESAEWRRPFDGRYRREFEEAFAGYVGAAFGVAMNSAGTGLDMAIAALDACPGDEVISCAINFPGTHLAVLGRGLRLVLCEPEPRSLNIDLERVPALLSPRTRAVLVTHMNGCPADVPRLERILSSAGRPDVRIVSDAARACGAAIGGQRVGSTGWLTVFSFQRKKAMTTLGEGGMITTSCPETAARLRRLQSFGAGVDWGTSYKMTEVQAAVGLVQLRRLDAMNDERIARAHARNELLAGHAALLLPEVPAGRRHVFSHYTLQLAEGAPAGVRDVLVERLALRHGVGCAIANPPTYLSNLLIADSTADQRPLPIADSAGERVFCPALHPRMTEDENRYVAEAVAGELDLALEEA